MLLGRDLTSNELPVPSQVTFFVGGTHGRRHLQSMTQDGTSVTCPIATFSPLAASK
jgi:hypothetical protein